MEEDRKRKRAEEKNEGLVTVFVALCPFAIFLSIYPIAFVVCSVRISIDSSSITQVVDKLSFIGSTASIYLFASSMLDTISKESFVAIHLMSQHSPSMLLIEYPTPFIGSIFGMTILPSPMASPFCNPFPYIDPSI